MSKAKFDAARELIKEKKYTQALSILSTIDHPTAREWETKIYKLAPDVNIPTKVEAEVKQAKPKRNSSCTGCLMVLVIIALVVMWAVNNQQASPQRPSSSGSTSSTRVAAPSVVEPTTVVKGTRDNPYLAGEAGQIRDGRFKVNSITRGATSAVENMNMFNTDPDPGEEWVLANITFYCDLPDSKTCVVTLMNLEMVGNLGNIYSYELITVLDNKFEGEVFGGGQKTGNVGFIVSQNDKNLMVAVNDLGDRIFFKG